MNMKKITIILLTIFTFAAFFTACENRTTEESATQETVQSTETPEIPPEILEDLKVKISEMNERELVLVGNLNDIEMLDFTLPDFEGTEHSLTDYKGQIIILNFWAIGCPPCINELPDFDKVAKKDGVVLITVAQKNILGNEREKSYEFIKQFDNVALWDENQATMNVYPSQYYPHSYIIDRSGTIRFVINSASYELLDELVTFCDEMLN